MSPYPTSTCEQGVDTERILYSLGDVVQLLNDIYVNAWVFNTASHAGYYVRAIALINLLAGE